MRMDMYKGPEGHAWLVPEGSETMVLVDCAGSFRHDARWYGSGWTEQDCPDWTAPKDVATKRHVATYEDGVVTLHANDLDNQTRSYVGPLSPRDRVLVGEHRRHA